VTRIELQPELADLGRPRIERIVVRNYRVLRNLRLNSISPLTVFVGPNGSGKSTLFDVFSFLSECLSLGLRKAWDKRGRFREMRSRGATGPIVVEIAYRERPRSPLITYHLAINEGPRGPFVEQEWLQWKRGRYGRPFRFLDFANGRGAVITGAEPEQDDTRIDSSLASSELLALNTIGQLSDNPRVVALRTFVQDWYLSYLNLTDARSAPEIGPQERLDANGGNLPNVVQYLSEQHSARFADIVQGLTTRVPGLSGVEAESLADGRLLLRVRDAPFDEPVLARFASDGTIKMLAYLILLRDPDPPTLLGIEEPENFLHPRLLQGLAEECRDLSARAQVLVSTHSPFFVNGLSPEEVWVFDRGPDGYATAVRASEMAGVSQMSSAGSQLGDLWMESYFSQGDPLRQSSR
jgi:predicted ATPase